MAEDDLEMDLETVDIFGYKDDSLELECKFGKRRFSTRSSLNTHRLDHMAKSAAQSKAGIKTGSSEEKLAHISQHFSIQNLVKIRNLNQNSNMKGIGIKHCEDKSENIITIESIASAVDLSSDTKQLISVNSFQYHKPFTTDTVEIQQDEIDTRMRENRKLRPNQTGNWTRILGLRLRTSTSTSHATCKLENDHGARLQASNTAGNTIMK